MTLDFGIDDWQLTINAESISLQEKLRYNISQVLSRHLGMGSISSYTSQESLLGVRNV